MFLAARSGLDGYERWDVACVRLLICAERDLVIAYKFTVWTIQKSIHNEQSDLNAVVNHQPLAMSIAGD